MSRWTRLRCNRSGDSFVAVARRCILHCEHTASGMHVRGYGPDGSYDVPPDGIVIGRTSSAEIHIAAEIGGHRTFRVYWRDPSWMFKISNEWACVRFNEEAPIGRGDFVGRALCDGDVIEIFTIGDQLVHRLRVELPDF